jgi:hypothetical protein
MRPAAIARAVPAAGPPASPASNLPRAAQYKSGLSPFKRFDNCSEESLDKQLLALPEVALNQVPDASTKLVAAALAVQGKSLLGPAALLGDRVALNGLPFLLDSDCHLTQERAQDLGVLSVALHKHIEACTTDHGPDAARLRELLAEQREDRAQWRGSEALPALVQILQVQEAPIRLLLVDLLDGMDDPRAQAAIAVRALVDLSAEVRQAAVRALAHKPATNIRRLLLEGFRHPWPPVAAHAAEALVALGDKEAIPALEALLEDPPPGLPAPAIVGLPRSIAVRELVRVNHVQNCLLCHPPSLKAEDPVRGVIPRPGRSPGSSNLYYTVASNDLFVRADMTYLRPEFSVSQRVVQAPAKRPEVQRFDYLVRVRVPTELDLQELGERRSQLAQAYREVVSFALREIGGGAAATKAGAFVAESETGHCWRP